MSCFNAFHSQLVTFLSVPHEVLFLQHKVFKEYAKIAVGPDFIHTLPSFIVLAAMTVVLWKNPLKVNWLPEVISRKPVRRMFQISASWVAVNAVLWMWLVFQRVMYCSVWSYWSYESEYRDVSYPWWQRVWSSYYPAPLQPPVLSAGFISWIISMVFAITVLGCALSASRMRTLLTEGFGKLQDFVAVARCYLLWSITRIREALSCERDVRLDQSEVSSVCDDCRSEMSTDVVHNPVRREIHPISYGTNWTPRPSFSGFKEAQRKFSVKPSRSPVTVAGGADHQDEEKLSPRQLRHRRGCHTVIPSNASDKSSGC